MRIELTTSSLPRKCSTTELQQLVKQKNLKFDDSDLQLSQFLTFYIKKSERKTGLEPATLSLEG